MSIDKRRKKYIVVCDICGAEMQPQESFRDALAQINSEAWGSHQERKRNGDPVWINICPECLEEDDYGTKRA